MSNINGFDYRSQKPMSKPKREWRNDIREVIASGGKRKIVEGETFLTVPITEDLGAPWGKCITQKLAVEIYANIPL